MASYWLRNAYSNQSGKIIISNGDTDSDYVDDLSNSIRPALSLNLQAVISARRVSSDNFKISTVYNSNGYELYHTIEFGQYPKTYVGRRLNNELTNKFKRGDRDLKPTNKIYTGYIVEDNDFLGCNEYEYLGQKYVRTIAKVFDKGNFYENGDQIINGSCSWLNVEPIKWKIKNWENLPKELNPEGDGSARFIYVVTEECIATFPFYPNNKDKNRSFWQNSTIRGYLNGINVNNIKSNGNTKYTAPKTSIKGVKVACWLF